MSDALYQTKIKIKIQNILIIFNQNCYQIYNERMQLRMVQKFVKYI